MGFETRNGRDEIGKSELKEGRDGKSMNSTMRQNETRRHKIK